MTKDCDFSNWDTFDETKAETEIHNHAIQAAYLAARGTSLLSDPSFTRSQMYWKGRADAAEDVRRLLKSH